MTRLVVAVLIAGLAIVVPSAAQVGSGKIAFVTQEGLYTINPDGNGLTLLKTENDGPGLGLFSPRWSPDGSRLAFVDRHGVEQDGRLIVMNADGSHEHLVVAARNIALSRQPWSPDSSRITWTARAPGTGYLYDVYTADASAGDVRRLTFDGHIGPAPSWSPSGSTLVYSRAEGLFVIGSDGQEERRIGPRGDDPTWSPSGEWIAFLGALGVTLVRSDGSDLRVVAVGNRSPTWSPDGTKIAFALWVQTGRYDFREDAYVVDSNGSNLKRLNRSDSWGAAPAWSPDGDRVLFQSGTLVTANVDGTCQMPLPGAARDADEISSWQPIPNGPPAGRDCHAIGVTTTTDEKTATAVVIGSTVANEGTKPLTKVTLEFSAHDAVSTAAVSRGCTVRRGLATCRLQRLEPGDSHDFSIRLEARRVPRTGRIIRFPARTRADASESLLPNGRAETSVTVAIRRCTERDRGGGTIRGTSSADRICGRRGADHIYPGPGSDAVRAGAGNDAISAVDGRRHLDQISCGPGRDRVLADRRDLIADDCEHVTRR